ncbi:MAG: ABC transporter substrate-binding protein [Burkholderiales bacterium]|nr:ABC transporter substrate-binding protein [Burkholderiales bacterium]
MRRTSKPGGGWLARLAAGAAALLVAAASAAQEAPDAMIRRVVDEVTAVIKSDREIQGGNRHKISQLVDTKILPYVNFLRMTQSAVGRHWSRATPEQQAALAKEFKGLLTNTYSGAFSTYRPDTVIEYKPFRLAAGESDAVVRSLVKPGSGEPIQLDYYVERFDGAWKVVDINVYGARLVETYRNQFNTEITANGIDGLIRALAAKNKAIEAKSKT